MIKVLIVEDTAVYRDYLTYILNADPDIQVIAVAKDGKEAVELTPQIKPDVITMDIHMPRMNGLEAIELIMQTHPVPIVIVGGSWRAADAEKTMQALEVGAIAIAEKPPGIGHPQHQAMAASLVQTVKLMSEIKVVRRRARSPGESTPARPVAPPASPAVASGSVAVVAVGASTGGPPVLQKIFSGLPNPFPVPVLVVQHIAAGFLPGMVEWLAHTTGQSIHIAVRGEQIQPGQIYFSPDNYHMGVDGRGRIILSDAEPENNLRPAVAFLFRTVAESFGARAVGVLLTGMGKDGAPELKLMRDRQAVTIAQDEESCVVYGMPGEAVKLNAANYVLPPGKIITILTKLAVES